MSCCPDSSDSDDEPKSEFRESTDVLWLCIFIIFWILMVFVATFAYVYGNPRQLINGADTFGNICGSKFNEKLSEFNLSGIKMSEKRYLFSMDSLNLLKICVEECPDRKVEDLAGLKEFYRRTGSSLCRYDVDLEYLSETNTSLFSPIGPCPVFNISKSVPIVNRCVPETYLLNHLASYNWDIIEEILRDLYRNWHWIFAFTVLSFSLSVILVSLIYVFASSISYIIMISIGIISLAVTSVLWWTYFEIKCKQDAAGEILLDEEINNEEAFIWYSAIATIFTLIILLLMFLMRKHVPLLVALFQESSNCLSELPILFFQPILSFALLLSFYIFWISVVICLSTTSYPISKDKHRFDVENSSLVVPVDYKVQELLSYTEVEYINIPWLKYMLFIYAVGLIWVSEFILSCQHMIVAGSVAKWYFRRDTRHTKSVVCTSIANLVCYHIGSLALGSLLIILLKLPRIVLTFLHKRLYKNRSSNCAKHALSCCSCCFYCLEKFIRYVDHNAYTMVAVQGTSFCSGGYRAWKILVPNALKLATVSCVGDFILLLAKCLVTVIATGIAVIVFKYDSTLHLFAASSLMICVFAYFVAHSVISLHEVVIDTLLLCISQDYQVNGTDGQWKTTVLATISYRKFKSCSIPPPIELQHRS